jgi:antitoxin PrlF
MQTKTRRKTGSALTTKGQVTLPKSMRDAFGWKPGTRIAFVREKDGIKLVVAGQDDPGEALVRRSRGIATVQLTTDQIMRMTRGGG